MAGPVEIVVMGILVALVLPADRDAEDEGRDEGDGPHQEEQDPAVPVQDFILF